MLDPDQRQLYVQALRPPAGFRFGEAIATTYSLDLAKLLTVPFAFVLPHLDVSSLDADGAVPLLQALRSVSNKLTVFCNRATIAVPHQTHVLYGMLESAVVQVAASERGSLHAKLWLIRLEPEDQGAEPLLRLVVLSRNLTHDRCWDVSVLLEGRITARHHSANRPLVDLLRALPSRSVGAISDGARARVERLSEQAWCTEWELPEGIHELKFHALGLKPRSPTWMPEQSRRLVVISPFIGADALKALAESTSAPVALLSRAEELERLAPGTLARFQSVLVLDEAATTEDGEDTTEEPPSRAPRGLHAKVYIAELRSDTHIYLGSANATDGALLAGRNLEFMVELVGKTRLLPGKGIDGLLSSQGLGAILRTYDPPQDLAVVDEAAEAARRALDSAGCALAEAGLSLVFEKNLDDYTPILRAAVPVRPLAGVLAMRAWLITASDANASEVSALTTIGQVHLHKCAPESATGFVAFELVADHPGVRHTFTLNLPVTDMPSDREEHVTRLVVSNRERLMKYLLMLLELELGGAIEAGLSGRSPGGWAALYEGGAGLLERLVRARSRAPQRLADFQHVVDALCATPEGREMVPAELLTVWAAVMPESAQP